MAACVALLPTTAAVLVATLSQDMTRWALAGLPVLALVLMVLLALGRGRVALGIVPVALVLYAASLPDAGREGLRETGAALVSVGGLAMMTLAVLVIERPSAPEVGEPLGSRSRRPWLERIRTAAAAVTLCGAAAVVLASADTDDGTHRLLAFSAIAFLWSLAYYVYFAIPQLNREYEVARVETQRRRPRARRWVTLQAGVSLTVALAAVALAVFGAAP